CLIRASARTNSRGMRSPLGGKFWIARCVWAPHSASLGTSSVPKLSRSTRVVAVIAPHSGLFTVEFDILPPEPLPTWMHTALTDALSPLDGRYAGKLAEVRHIFSEA